MLQNAREYGRVSKILVTIILSIFLDDSEPFAAVLEVQFQKFLHFFFYFPKILKKIGKKLPGYGGCGRKWFLAKNIDPFTHEAVLEFWFVLIDLPLLFWTLTFYAKSFFKECRGVRAPLGD